MGCPACGCDVTLNEIEALASEAEADATKARAFKAQNAPAVSGSGIVFARGHSVGWDDSFGKIDLSLAPEIKTCAACGVMYKIDILGVIGASLDSIKRDAGALDAVSSLAYLGRVKEILDRLEPYARSET